MSSPTTRTANALRWVALVGTLASIATLEYLAGQAAGWGAFRSAGVPLGIDAFVMAVLLAPRSSGFDRLAALALMEFTVVVSAVAGDHEKAADGKPANVALGAVLATALVFALWRLDETIRADKQHDDQLADALRRLAVAEREAGDLRERLARVPVQPVTPVTKLGVSEPDSNPEPRNHESSGIRKSKGCPTREAARQTLLDLDLAGKLAETSNAELARQHGGSDVWWGNRRREYLAEIEKFSTEAGAL